MAAAAEAARPLHAAAAAARARPAKAGGRGGLLLLLLAAKAAQAAGDDAARVGGECRRPGPLPPADARRQGALGAVAPPAGQGLGRRRRSRRRRGGVGGQEAKEGGRDGRQALQAERQGVRRGRGRAAAGVHHGRRAARAGARRQGHRRRPPPRQAAQGEQGGGGRCGRRRRGGRRGCGAGPAHCRNARARRLAPAEERLAARHVVAHPRGQAACKVERGRGERDTRRRHLRRDARLQRRGRRRQVRQPVPRADRSGIAHQGARPSPVADRVQRLLRRQPAARAPEAVVPRLRAAARRRRAVPPRARSRRQRVRHVALPGLLWQALLEDTARAAPRGAAGGGAQAAAVRLRAADLEAGGRARARRLCAVHRVRAVVPLCVRALPVARPAAARLAARVGALRVHPLRAGRQARVAEAARAADAPRHGPAHLHALRRDGGERRGGAQGGGRVAAEAAGGARGFAQAAALRGRQGAQAAVRRRLRHGVPLPLAGHLRLPGGGGPRRLPLRHVRAGVRRRLPAPKHQPHLHLVPRLYPLATHVAAGPAVRRLPRHRQRLPAVRRRGRLQPRALVGRATQGW
mmetsp:Transcript_34027/g.107013  ORF Transcript_34027/g.107013 Transcript_34027/m.107013 type:complete len:577 (+) Transcript_34027:929-2659(+)